MNDNYFRYSYEKCPICEKDFTNNDDIVVCPLCGTPHHRECYKQNGECGNYDKHNEGFRWTPSVENKRVTEDTAPLPPLDNIVENGQSIPPQPNAFFGANPLSQFPKDLEEDASTEEVAGFVQINAIKYIRNFFYTKSNKKTFNWGAFFLAPYWFFYRKLYKLGAIFMALTLLLTVGFNVLPPMQTLYNDMAEWTEKYSVEDADEFTEEEIAQAYKEQQELILGNPTGVILMLTQGALSRALQLFIGFNANKWYYNHTITSIKKIKSEESDPQKQRLLCFKAGGCSVGATFLAILANNMIVMAVEMLLTYIK